MSQPASTAPASAAPTGRREKRRLETVERILDAAEELFATHGYDETKVADICAKANVAYGTFFNYFPAKQDLLQAMGDRGVAEIARDLEALAERSLPLEKALVELFRSGASQLEGADPGRRALSARVQAAAFSNPALERDHNLHAAFEQFIARGVAAGIVRDDIPTETLSDHLSSAYMTMYLRWVHIDDFPVRKRARSLARSLADHLAPKN